MHIDFAPPSGGTYNNAGSSRQLVSYCEHEDLERMEKGIYTDGFFNLTEDNIYKSTVIKDIDTNIGQLLKTEIFQSSEKENNISCNLDSKQENKYSNNQQNNSSGDSLLSIFSLRDGNNYDATLAEELQAQKHKKRKMIKR